MINETTQLRDLNVLFYNFFLGIK